jgi:hypothetical protein
MQLKKLLMIPEPSIPFLPDISYLKPQALQNTGRHILVVS